jgi:hypothetical protein
LEATPAKATVQKAKPYFTPPNNLQRFVKLLTFCIFAPPKRIKLSVILTKTCQNYRFACLALFFSSLKNHLFATDN